MLRLAQIKLPLDHNKDDLVAAIISYFAIDAAKLLEYTVYKRSYDARKNEMVLVYIVDVKLQDEAKIFKKFKHDLVSCWLR